MCWRRTSETFQEHEDVGDLCCEGTFNNRSISWSQGQVLCVKVQIVLPDPFLLGKYDLTERACQHKALVCLCMYVR